MGNQFIPIVPDEVSEPAVNRSCIEAISCFSANQQVKYLNLFNKMPTQVQGKKTNFTGESRIIFQLLLHFVQVDIDEITSGITFRSGRYMFVN
jgi:hypothetical protein